MKHERFTGKTHDELRTHLLESQEKLRSLQFNLKLGKVQDTTAIAKTKRTIARLLTTLASYGTNA